MRVRVPRGGALGLAVAGATAACNVLTGLSSLNEVPGDAGSLEDVTQSRDGGKDATGDAKGSLDGRVMSDGMGASDAGEDTACDDAMLSSDPHNCGACGKSCGVESCVDASCTPAVLASGLTLNGRIALDSKNVYFLTSSSVDSVPIEGGPVTQLATGLSNLNYLAVDSSYVYFSIEPPSDTGPIDRVSLLGGEVSTVTGNRPGVNQVLVYGSDLYWAEQGTGTSNGAIMKLALGGGIPTTVVGGQVGPERLAIDSKYAYFSNLDYSGTTIIEAPLDGGTTLTLSNVATPIAVAIDSMNVYFSVKAADGAVYRATKGSATTAMLASSPAVEDLATDGTNVYFSDTSLGTLNRVPVGGGTVSTLVSGLSMPRSIALDATSVYCVVSGSGTILRLNK